MDWGAFLEQSNTPTQGWNTQGGDQGGARQFLRDQRGRFMSPNQGQNMMQRGANFDPAGQGQQQYNNVIDLQQALQGELGGALQQQGVALTEQQRELENLRNQSQQNQALIDGLRNVFNPQEQVDPVDEKIGHLESQLDYYLQQGLEAEKRGEPMPLTINLAVQGLQNDIAALQDKKQTQSHIKKLENQIKALSDPNVKADTAAYQNLDSMIIDNVEKIYGSGEETRIQRGAQFNAIADQISREVQNIKQRQPQIWDQIRRSPDKQRKMVAYFVEQNLPPMVRQKMAQEKLMSTPMGEDELLQAFQEANQIEDPELRNEIQTKIRRDYHSVRHQRSSKYHQGGQKSQNTGLNQLYG